MILSVGVGFQSSPALRQIIAFRSSFLRITSVSINPTSFPSDYRLQQLLPLDLFSVDQSNQISVRMSPSSQFFLLISSKSINPTSEKYKFNVRSCVSTATDILRESRICPYTVPEFINGYHEPFDRREFQTQRFHSSLFELQFQTVFLDDVFSVFRCIVWFACYLSLATMLYFLCCTHNMHGVQRRRQLIWWQWPFNLLFDGVGQ